MLGLCFESFECLEKVLTLILYQNKYTYTIKVGDISLPPCFALLKNIYA